MKQKKIWSALMLSILIFLCACGQGTQRTDEGPEVLKQDQTEAVQQNNSSEIPVHITNETLDVEGLDREFHIFFFFFSHI